MNPEAKIVGFFRFRDAIFIARSTRLTPHPLSKNYYLKAFSKVMVLKTFILTFLIANI